VDRWDTGLVDITGAGGLLVQVNGRSAQPVIDWLAARDEQWKSRHPVCGDRHVGDLRQGRPGGVAPCAADRLKPPTTSLIAWL
jgi:hypothetical protein